MTATVPQQIKQTIQQWNLSKWRIKLVEGDEIVKQLETFASNNSTIVGFAEFRMIGAVKAKGLEFAISESFSSSSGQKHSISKRIEEIEKKDKKEWTAEEIELEKTSFEILFCWGTISWEKENRGKPKVHAHIMMAENSGHGNSFGGHLVRGTISIVGEIIIDVMSTTKSIVGKENWDLSFVPTA